jgi:hypothetical protein
MKRLSVLFVAIAFAISCGSSSSTSPTGSPTKPTFTATLLPANEVPPITGAEAGGSGNVTVTFDTTTNSSGQITAATATFVVNLSGFPAGTNMNVAHIHEGAPGSIGSVKISTTLSAADQVVTNSAGSISFVKAGVAAQAEVVQGIINNPAAYYFNVHSSLNPGGVARGVGRL